MQELKEAAEAACRVMEQYLQDQGYTVSFGVEGTDTEHFQHVGSGLNVKLRGRRLDTVRKPAAQVVKPFMPDWVREPESGLKAGVKALLEKFQKGIQNATDVCTGQRPHWELEQVAERAGDIHPDDPIPKLLKAVVTLRKNAEATAEQLKEAKAELAQKKDPDEQLRERLKLKMRTKYVEQRGVLREFQTYIFEHYSAMFPEHLPGRPEGMDVVSEFLERVGDE